VHKRTPAAGGALYAHLLRVGASSKLLAAGGDYGVYLLGDATDLVWIWMRLTPQGELSPNDTLDVRSMHEEGGITINALFRAWPNWWGEPSTASPMAKGKAAAAAVGGSAVGPCSIVVRNGVGRAF